MPYEDLYASGGLILDDPRLDFGLIKFPARQLPWTPVSFAVPIPYPYGQDDRDSSDLLLVGKRGIWEERHTRLLVSHPRSLTEWSVFRKRFGVDVDLFFDKMLWRTLFTSVDEAMKYCGDLGTVERPEINEEAERLPGPSVLYLDALQRLCEARSISLGDAFVSSFSIVNDRLRMCGKDVASTLNKKMRRFSSVYLEGTFLESGDRLRGISPLSEPVSISMCEGSSGSAVFSFPSLCAAGLETEGETEGETESEIEGEESDPMDRFGFQMVPHLVAIAKGFSRKEITRFDAFQEPREEFPNEVVSFRSHLLRDFYEKHVAPCVRDLGESAARAVDRYLIQSSLIF